MWNSTNEYRCSVLIKGRKPAPEVEYRASTYIEGREGTPYELELENRSHGRILVIPSVDGLSVLDGKPAGVNSPGYLLEGHSRLKIPGWKVNRSMAAEFVFNAIGKNKNYAEQTGQDSHNQGVIGFMIFKEKTYSNINQFTYTGGVLRGSTGGTGTMFKGHPGIGASSFSTGPGATTLSVGSTMDMMNVATKGVCMNSLSVAPEAGLGTGWGDAVDFNTSETTFEKENPLLPNAVLQIIYDTIRNLRYIGVPVEKFNVGGGRQREAFPASPYVSGTGAPPPPGWSPKKRRH